MAKTLERKGSSRNQQQYLQRTYNKARGRADNDEAVARWARSLMQPCDIEGEDPDFEYLDIAQRLLTIQHFNHLALAGMEPEPEDVDRVRGIVKPATFDRLLDGSLFLLAESTPDDFDYLLPHWYESSPFYGQCLMIRHHGPRGEKNRQPHGQPSAALLGRLAELADLAQAGYKVLVEVTEDAAAWYRLFLRLDMDTYSEHGPVGMEGEWARQSLQVAAIVAVGLDPLRPVITAEVFRLASDLASEGVRLARVHA